MRLIVKKGTLRQAIDRSRQYPAHNYVGFIIRRLREISGTSQGGLASRSVANLSYLSAVENGANNISIRKIWLVCNALALQPNLLINIQNNIGNASDLINAR